MINLFKHVLKTDLVDIPVDPSNKWIYTREVEDSPVVDTPRVGGEFLLEISTKKPIIWDASHGTPVYVPVNLPLKNIYHQYIALVFQNPPVIPSEEE